MPLHYCVGFFLDKFKPYGQRRTLKSSNMHGMIFQQHDTIITAIPGDSLPIFLARPKAALPIIISITSCLLLISLIYGRFQELLLPRSTFTQGNFVMKPLWTKTIGPPTVKAFGVLSFIKKIFKYFISEACLSRATTILITSLISLMIFAWGLFTRNKTKLLY